jgi:hypothetical protein
MILDLTQDVKPNIKTMAKNVELPESLRRLPQRFALSDEHGIVGKNSKTVKLGKVSGANNPTWADIVRNESAMENHHKTVKIQLNKGEK